MLPAGQDSAAAEKALRAAAHRTLRTVTEEYAELRFNTMVAHLMELSNLLQRYRGTEAAGSAAWDEAVRLLLLMLAPAAPHITEELWSRLAEARGEAWASHPHPALAGGGRGRRRRERARSPGPGQRQAPRQGHGPGRDRRGGAGSHRPGAAQDRGRAGRQEPLKVIHAGGKLVNIVVR